MSWREGLFAKEYQYHRENGIRHFEKGNLGESRIQLEKALEILRKVKSREEEDLESRLQEISLKLTSQSIDQARKYWDDGDLENALNFFQNALGTVRSESMKEELLVEISRLKLEMEPQEQIQALQEQIKENPQDLDQHFQLAMEYALHGYFEQAIHELKGVLEKDPKNEEALLRIGNACADSTRHFEAMDYYKQGLAAKGELQAQFHYRIGNLHQLASNHQEALASYEKCVEMDGEHLDALLSSAKILSRVEDRDQAIDAYEKVLSLDPDDGESLLAIAKLWEDGGYLKNAREIWEEIQDKNCDPIFKEEAQERIRFYESQF